MTAAISDSPAVADPAGSASGPDGSLPKLEVLDDRLLHWLGSALVGHPVLSFAALALFLTCVRIVIEARFDMNTARLMLQESSPATVLTGSLLDLGLLGVVVVIIGAAAVLVALRQRLEQDIGGAGGLAGAGVALALLLLPWHFGCLTILGGVVTWAVIRWRDLKDPEARARKWRVWTWFFGAFVIAAPIITPMWLPAESLRVGTETFTGYVLTGTTGDLVILRHDDREVLYVDRSDVNARALCRLPLHDNRTSIAVIFDIDPSPQERCP